jgi:hypothetical protein
MKQVLQPWAVLHVEAAAGDAFAARIDGITGYMHRMNHQMPYGMPASHDSTNQGLPGQDNCHMTPLQAYILICTHHLSF